MADATEALEIMTNGSPGHLRLPRASPRGRAWVGDFVGTDKCRLAGRCRGVLRWVRGGMTTVTKLSERITVDPEQCGGRPCIRGMRIRVIDVLDLLANGLSAEQVIEELPDLEIEDVRACLRFASRRLDHPVLAA